MSSKKIATITTIVTILFPILFFQTPAQAGTSICYEVQDSDGWSYVRNLETRQVVGKLYNSTTFPSAYTTNDGNVIIDGPSEGKLVISRSRVRQVPSVRCRMKYWMVGDRDGYVNLRSTPNGTVIGQVNDSETVLSLERSIDRKWTRVITSQGTIGWIHSSRLVELSN